MIVTHSECVFVALGVQHATRIRHVAICALPRSTIFSPHYLTNGTIFEGGGIIYWTQNVCFDFMYNFCLKHFRFQEFSWILLKMYIGLRAKCRLLLSDFNETWILWTDFFEIYSDSKFHENPSGGSRVVLCGRKEGYDTANSGFSQLAERSYRRLKSTFCPTQLYLCVLCGSENKQRLFPYTTLTDWFL